MHSKGRVEILHSFAVEPIKFDIGFHAETARSATAAAACACRASLCKLHIHDRRPRWAPPYRLRAAPILVSLGSISTHRTRAAAARPQSAGECKSHTTGFGACPCMFVAIMLYLALCCKHHWTICFGNTIQQRQHASIASPDDYMHMQHGNFVLICKNLCLQFVASTEDWRSLRATGLAYHPNVSVATYQAPYSESRLRGTINGYRGSPLHAVLETFFNIRDYSDAMLTDRRLFCQVQVSQLHAVMRQITVTEYCC